MMATRCETCGCAIDGSDVLFSSDGNPVCARCEAQCEIDGLQVKQSGRVLAWIAIVLGVVSFLVDPVYAVSAATVLVSVATLLTTKRPAGEPMTAARRRLHVRTMAAVAIGLVVVSHFGGVVYLLLLGPR
jgi:hypothetical protein